VVNSHCFSFQELIDELGIHFLLFDRAGYGESDPDPKRTVKSEALDIQELADQLQLGSKFYVIGVSVGSYSTWSCLKYIPDRQSTLFNSSFMFFFFFLLRHVKTQLLHFTSKPFSRLAGVAFVVPVVNHRWPSLPNSFVDNSIIYIFLLWFLFYRGNFFIPV